MPCSSLNSLGKTLFVDFYYDFKQYSLGLISYSELAYKLMQEKPRKKNNTIETQGKRASNGKSIFNRNKQIEALKIIIDSKVPMETKNKAQKILEHETKSTRFVSNDIKYIKFDGDEL